MFEEKSRQGDDDGDLRRDEDESTHHSGLRVFEHSQAFLLVEHTFKYLACQRALNLRASAWWSSSYHRLT